MLQELLDPSPSTINLRILNRRGGVGLAGQTKFGIDACAGEILKLTPQPHHQSTKLRIMTTAGRYLLSVGCQRLMCVEICYEMCVEICYEMCTVMINLTLMHVQQKFSYSHAWNMGIIITSNG
jgi:hypothetical protein